MNFSFNIPTYVCCFQVISAHRFRRNKSWFTASYHTTAIHSVPFQIEKSTQQRQRSNNVT